MAANPSNDKANSAKASKKQRAANAKNQGSVDVRSAVYEDQWIAAWAKVGVDKS